MSTAISSGKITSNHCEPSYCGDSHVGCHGGECSDSALLLARTVNFLSDIIEGLLMNGSKVKLFMQLAGQPLARKFVTGTPEERKLGAQLLLSEVLEFVTAGLGVTPIVDGQPITNPDSLRYEITAEPSRQEMLDGLADVAYTMYWNANAFGVPLEEGFELVCENNLEKFVRLENKDFAEGELRRQEWHCDRGVNWPTEVHRVEVVEVEQIRYAVGKDERGKVRKPGHFQPVNLKELLEG